MRTVVYDLTPAVTALTGVNTATPTLLTPPLYDSSSPAVQQIPVWVDLLVALGAVTPSGGLENVAGPYNIAAQFDVGDSTTLFQGFSQALQVEFGGITIVGMSKIPGPNESRIFRLNFSYNNFATSNWGPWPVYKIGLQVRKDNSGVNTVNLRKVAAYVHYGRSLSYQ